MFENKYPVFRKGNVVDKESLELLRDNPSEILHLMYFNKKDGIIKGFDLITDEENKEVIVTKGIVKYQNEIYWMYEDYKFKMPETENRYVLKLRLISNIEERKYYKRKGEFVLETLDDSGTDGIEITRFITREGAELRNDYMNFQDLRRDFNLLEIINSKYSSNHKFGTLHPKITELWGSEAAKKENLDIFDINFYVNCLQGSVEREVIISYINAKLNLHKSDYTNEELYMNLLKILGELGKERKNVEKRRVIPQKITIE